MEAKGKREMKLKIGWKRSEIERMWVVMEGEKA